MKLLGTVSIPAGVSRSNLTTGAATKDLGTLAAGNLDTVVRATIGGTAGNAYTVQATGDSAAAAGVTIARSGTALHIHYESGVSTVALVEAAIAALTGSDKLIAVDVAGTGATVLNAPGDNFVATALAGGAAGAFNIPAKVPAVYVLASAASVAYESGPVTGTADPVVATSSDFPLTSGIAFGESLPPWGAAPVVAFYNGGGGAATVRVFGTGN